MAAPLPQLNFSDENESKAYVNGLAELKSLLTVSRTTPQSLASAQAELDAMTEPQVQQMISLGLQQLRERLDVAKVENNFRHVEEQLLRPVIEDADWLHTAFGIDPVRLRLLVVLHDLGKVEIPTDLWVVLSQKFPNDFVAREILTHEYASMHWIARLGEQLRLSAKTVWALQTLIANHNFGPDLCHARHKHLLNNWWPAHFRERIIPMLKELNFDLDALYDKSADGQYQYNHSEDNAYAALLTVYDRAIATKFNNFGVATWQKFAEQDYNAWQTLAITDPSLPNPLRPAALINKMEQAALWAETEIEAMWKILAEKHVKEDQRKDFRLAEFMPYEKQSEGVRRLLRAIERVKSANVSESSGRLLYRTKTGELYRVDDKRRDFPDQKGKLFWWNGANNSWSLIAEDRSPIKLYFEIIRGDL